MPTRPGSKCYWIMNMSGADIPNDFERGWSGHEHGKHNGLVEGQGAPYIGFVPCPSDGLGEGECRLLK